MWQHNVCAIQEMHTSCFPDHSVQNTTRVLEYGTARGDYFYFPNIYSICMYITALLDYPHPFCWNHLWLKRKTSSKVVIRPIFVTQNIH